MRNAVTFIFTTGILFSLVICLETKVFAKGNDGRSMRSYMTASEIAGIAEAAYADGLSTGMARSLPVAYSKNSRLQIVILFYREPAIKDVERMYPPHHIVAIDPTNGQVMKNGPCTPKMFGFDQAVAAPTQGFGLDPGVSADVFWERYDRFMEISSVVWKAYASGSSDLTQQSTQIVREYYEIFNKIAKKPLLPYYRAVAPDFFKWLEKVAR
jgi:hypothetical protein